MAMWDSWKKGRGKDVPQWSWEMVMVFEATCDAATLAAILGIPGT